MQRPVIKKILVFSNGEKIGDGIIKLQLLDEIKKRLPNHKLYWITDTGKTVYAGILRNIASKFIDVFYEQANLSPFFWQKISNKFNFNNEYFDYILDTQKSVLRTIALKRIRHNNFISGTANGLFSSKKIKYKLKDKKYILTYMFSLLDLIKKRNIHANYNIPIDPNIEKTVSKILSNKKNYFGIAPGAGEKEKIWPLDKFIKICDYMINKNFDLVFFVGPDEIYMKEKLKKLYPSSIFIEELITQYSNIEVVMSSTKFLKLAIANDSGVSHMLSTGYCPLIKLFGPKDPKKFTPIRNNIHTISSNEYNSFNINHIPTQRVIEEIKNLILNDS